VYDSGHCFLNLAFLFLSHLLRRRTGWLLLMPTVLNASACWFGVKLLEFLVSLSRRRSGSRSRSPYGSSHRGRSDRDVEPRTEFITEFGGSLAELPLGPPSAPPLEKPSRSDNLTLSQFRLMTMNVSLMEEEQRSTRSSRSEALTKSCSLRIAFVLHTKRVPLWRGRHVLRVQVQWFGEKLERPHL
jgi:hypothetical protein